MNQPDTWEEELERQQQQLLYYLPELNEDEHRVFNTIFGQIHNLFCSQEERVRAHWLRSEIEKLEGETKGLVTLNCYGNCNPRCHDSGKDIALTTIITRYKEELKELTGE